MKSESSEIIDLKRIKMLIVKHELTPREVAERIGMHYGTFMAKLRGDYLFQISDLNALAILFNVNVTDFFYTNSPQKWDKEREE